jgi:HAD superfamily hydrolase (TIGR01484 family)
MDNLEKKLVLFDLDGTLTKSKSPIDSVMAELICKLLISKKVAIISGGGYPQFLTQFVSKLPIGSENFNNLYLLPTSGTKLYVWKGNWHEEYSEDLNEKEREKIMMALNSTINSPVYEKPATLYGEIIEDRGSQITFSALGQNAPAEIKYAWDPTRSKREAIANAIRKKIPEFDVRVGGATSVDITRKGVNKAYGIMKMAQYLNLTIHDIVFVGDALFYGGNDYPAKTTGVDCVSVKGPEETANLIRSWLA